jgi:hypothetical protein
MITYTHHNNLAKTHTIATTKYILTIFSMVYPSIHFGGSALVAFVNFPGSRFRTGDVVEMLLLEARVGEVLLIGELDELSFNCAKFLLLANIFIL